MEKVSCCSMKQFVDPMFIVLPPQAGDTRLTDTRADEQERGITIK